jgi:hypothetical protein
MFRTMSQFIFRDSTVYYTSYRCTVLIKIYKLVDKMSLTVLSLWSLYLLLCVHHLFASGIPLYIYIYIYIYIYTTSKQMASMKQQIQCPKLNTVSDILCTNLCILMSTIHRFFFPMAWQPLWGPRPPHFSKLHVHTIFLDTPHSSYVDSWCNKQLSPWRWTVT